MFQISLRKTLFLMTLWVGLFSLFPHNQAFCMDWCCCCFAKGTPLRAPSEADSLVNSVVQDGKTTPPLVITEKEEDPLPLQKPASPPSGSIEVTMESPGFTWPPSDITVVRHTDQGTVWKSSETTFGSENHPPQFLDGAGTQNKRLAKKFSSQDVEWKIFPQNSDEYTDYKRVVVQRCEQDIKTTVASFLQEVETQWKADPSSLSFAFFTSGKYYYYFAKQDSKKVMYIQMPNKDDPDSTTISTRTAMSKRPESRTPSSRTPSKTPGKVTRQVPPLPSGVGTPDANHRR